MRRLLLATSLLISVSVAVADLSRDVSLCNYGAGVSHNAGSGNAACNTDCSPSTIANCASDSGGTRRVRFETTTFGAGEVSWDISDCAAGAYEKILVTHPGSWAQGYAEDWQPALPEYCVITIGGWAGGWWHNRLDKNDGGTNQAGKRVAAAVEYFVEQVNVDNKGVAVAGSSGGCLAMSMCPIVHTDECDIAADIEFFGCISGGTHYDVELQCNSLSCSPSDCVNNDDGSIGAGNPPGSSRPGWVASRKSELDGAEPGGVGCMAGTASNLPNYSLEQQMDATPWAGTFWAWVGTQSGGGDDDANGVVWGLGHTFNLTAKLTGPRTWVENTSCGHGQGLAIASSASCAGDLLSALQNLLTPPAGVPPVDNLHRTDKTGP